MGLIDDNTFEGCRSLKIVDLPVRLKKIGRGAFRGCTSLSSLILPVGVEIIGFDAFSGCTSLSRIALPKGMRELEDLDVFGGCDSLELISFGGSEEAWRMLTRGATVTVNRTDLSVGTPKILFMDFKDEI